MDCCGDNRREGVDGSDVLWIREREDKVCQIEIKVLWDHLWTLILKYLPLIFRL
jgi:hypothetical protein